MSDFNNKLVIDLFEERDKLRAENERLTKKIQQLYEGAEEQNQRIKRLRDGIAKQNQTIEQACGKVLGYPWFKDDQKNFPGSTEKDGVCVGEHVAETIVCELVGKYTEALDRIQRLEEAGDALLELCEADESKFHLADHIDARCEQWIKTKEAKP